MPCLRKSAISDVLPAGRRTGDHDGAAVVGRHADHLQRLNRLPSLVFRVGIQEHDERTIWKYRRINAR